MNRQPGEALWRRYAGDVAVRPPAWAAALAARLLPGVRFVVDARRRQIALTFDDGPDAAVTPALLDALARHGSTATFFVIGANVDGNEAVLRRAVDEGHELAAHGMDATPTARLSRARFSDELRRCVDLLAPWQRVRHFRPASGWIRPDQLAIVRRMGLACALGSVTLARDPVVDPPRAARLLDRQIRSGDVVVLHEGTPKRRSVVACTDHLLGRLAARGIAVMSLAELVNPGP